MLDYFILELKKPVRDEEELSENVTTLKAYRYQSTLPGVAENVHGFVGTPINFVRLRPHKTSLID